MRLLYLIFDVYNESGSVNGPFAYDVSLYADGKKASEAEGMLLKSIDGIPERNSYDIDDGTCVYFVTDFEVENGWENIEIFYDEDYSWVISQDDISTEPFIKTSLFTPKSRAVTAEGETIYSEDYQIIFDGFCFYSTEIFGDTTNYAIYKFTINNTSSETLDYELTGYEMRGYNNGYLSSEADYTVDDNIDGYTNVYEVGSIVPGMYANVYAAFETDTTEGSFMCSYDVGYIYNDVLGFVYCER